jgi:hypothetical protein
VKWKARLGIAAAGAVAIVCCGCSSPARPSFDPMPLDPFNLTAALGPVTGTGSGTLTVTASRTMSLTMGCIGKGILTVSGPLSAGAVLCHDARSGRGAFASYYWAHVRAQRGERIKLRVDADAKTIWDIRVGGLPRHCVDDVCASTARP